jgi:hypothetical protein
MSELTRWMGRWASRAGTVIFIVGQREAIIRGEEIISSEIEQRIVSNHQLVEVIKNRTNSFFAFWVTDANICDAAVSVMRTPFEGAPPCLW